MSHWTKSRIFLIDKEVYYRRLTLQILREKVPGALADSAGSKEDRDLISRFDPTLVIFGISEEDQSCLDMVRWLRTPDVTPVPGVGVLLMAGGISDELVKRSIFAGVDFIITKPTSPRVLHARIENLAINPTPQFHTATYTGPDRRRLPGEVHTGPDRRK